MNDELCFQQVNQIIPPDDGTQQICSAADSLEQTQALHARVWNSERTQHIVWERPAEPRFQVAQSGRRGNWKVVYPPVAYLAVLALFIFALVLRTHSHSLPVSAAPRHVPQAATAFWGTNSALAGNWQSQQRAPAKVMSPGTPTISSLRVRPSLYAVNPVQTVAPINATIPAHADTSYPPSGFRFAPAAPVAGSMPPVQPPY